MRILGLCSYPREAAATRFRLEQFVEPLRERGIELTVSPFLDSAGFRKLYESGGTAAKLLGLGMPLVNRVREVFDVRKYDLIFVQREATFFGPGVFEWLFEKIGNIPMVLDLDDATYIRYVSPSYGRLGSFLKAFGKTDALIDRASAVTCGNRYIAAYVEGRGGNAVIVPTVVNTDEFRPAERSHDVPVIGWIGTHSTFNVLKSFFPILESIGRKHRYLLKIVGAGVDKIDIDGIETANLKWSLEREISDFQSLDVGLYPITTTHSMPADWILAKSGFKAIQYMSVGVPFVMSPVGVCAEMGEPNVTHFNADTPEEWERALDKLLSDVILRKEMGRAGRHYSLENYSLTDQTEKLAAVFTDVAKARS